MAEANDPSPPGISSTLPLEEQFDINFISQAMSEYMGMPIEFWKENFEYFYSQCRLRPQSPYNSRLIIRSLIGLIRELRPYLSAQHPAYRRS
jgi:hypothetical protein